MGDLGPCHVRFLSYDEELKKKQLQKFQILRKIKTHYGCIFNSLEFDFLKIHKHPHIYNFI